MLQHRRADGAVREVKMSIAAVNFDSELFQLRCDEDNAERELTDPSINAELFRVFCPPVLDQFSRDLKVIDPDAERIVFTFAKRQARRLGNPTWIEKQVLHPTQFRDSKTGEYRTPGNPTPSPINESPRLGVFGELKSDLEEERVLSLPLVHSEESISLKQEAEKQRAGGSWRGSTEQTKYEHFRKTVKLRMNLGEYIQQLRLAGRQKRSSSTLREALFQPVFKAKGADSYEVFRRDPEIDCSYPFGIPLTEERSAKVEDYVKSREASLPGAFLDVEQRVNSLIRFSLPGVLSELAGFTVLDYILKYCWIKKELMTVYATWFTNAKSWEKFSPSTMIRDHAQLSSNGFMNEQDIEEFAGMFRFAASYSMTYETYVAVMALAARLYRSTGKERDALKYLGGPLEYLDFKDIAQKLEGVEINETLRALLLRLGKMCTEPKFIRIKAHAF